MRWPTRLVAALVCMGVAGCGPDDRAPVEAEPGAPLPGLTAAELSRFEAGKALFDRSFTPEEGLGPIFNQTRCSSCHDLPTSGGHGAEPVTKFSRFDDVEGCDRLEELGGDLVQQVVVPALRERGVVPEQIPPQATAASDLVPPALYGLGLVEAVAEEVLLLRADPDDRDRDGISGRPGRGPDMSFGRFGLKAQHATVAGFVEEAIRLELGLTTPDHPTEQTRNGRPLPQDADPAPDPEVDETQLELLATYVRFLAPPAPRVPADEPGRAAARRGERIFDDVGCATCHTPTLVTAPSESAALDAKRFRVYSDLLLHDMGPELADICAPGASPSEWRTSRLVGLGLRSEFLHDGRAQRLENAILLHGGEGEASREAYRRLDQASKDALLRFLQTL